MNKINKDDLIDIQKEITEAYYERAEEINKKYSINKGLKNSFKATGLMLILSLFASLLPFNTVSVVAWILTALMSGALAGHCIAKYNNHIKREDLKQKINELEQLQKDMAIDYNINADKKINERLLSSGKIYKDSRDYNYNQTNSL